MYPKNQYVRRILFIAVTCFFFLALQNRLSAQNAIVTENALTGNLPSEWDVSGVGDPTIQGFATDISVNRGSTISFKINTDATAYRIDIYRLGYYGGRGARKVATINPSVTLPQTQPNFVRDAATGLVDCGNWAVSASWAVPSTAVSGVYIARPVRTDTAGASHIVFVVRNDSSNSDMLFQTSDTTWHAYNLFGGADFYRGNGPGSAGRCYKVSYNRPFMNRDPSGLNSGSVEGFLWDSEYPMIRWLEANGYNVSYATDLDSDRRGVAALTSHRIFLSNGHDEYWSKQHRANVEAARAAGLNLAFFSGNEVFWKCRWENSIAGSSTPYRTFVCYKETWDNQKLDPSGEWTGTWRDPRFSPPYDGNYPENALTGTIYYVDAFRNDSLTVSSAEGKLRFWRNTGIDTLADGQTATLPAGILGFEWDETPDNGFQPPGQIRMSTTTMGVNRYSILYGQTVAPGVATHHLSLYRHSSGALVFGAGSTQWSWGLDATHDRPGTPIDTRVKQATVNLFADMGVQPATLQSGLVAATQSTDFTPPTSVITAPVGGVVSTGAPVTIIGTATDAGGGKVGGVEFSLDGGATWHPASGTTSWSAKWMPSGPGLVTIKTRAVDDSGRLETPGAGITVDVVDNPVGCSLFPPDAAPMIFSQPDVPSLEVGMRFTSDRNGWIKAIRFYKSAINTGTHAGHLWANDGTLLASATFTNETPSGWQEVQLSTPVAITANTVYVVSYHLDSGYFSFDPGFFASSGYDRPPLHAPMDGVFGFNGVNHVGPSAFPTGTYNSSNYWVDVVFTPSLTTDTTAPSVTTVSPANGATGVSTGTSVSATFSEDIAPWTLGSPNYSYPNATPAFTFAPPTDSAHQDMLRTFKMGKDIQLTLSQVPNGTYDVYLWTFEDSNPLTATISVEGTVVGTYSSGMAGSWKRLGPFTKTISDGNIQIRFQSNDVALVSGLEVWQGGGTPPPTPPSTDTFYRAVNLGGPAMTMDGHNWEANNELTPNFTFNYFNSGLPGGNLGGIPGFVFNPPVDTPEHAEMLRTYRWNHDVQFSLTSIPTGSYDVYVWTFEPNAPLSASLSIEQNTFLPNYSTGPAGHWDRLGPFPVTVADGNIQVQFLCINQTDAGFLSGVEVWQSSAPLQPPAGTFYRAINVGGPATVIDGHNWEGETTSNYTSNTTPNAVSLKDPQNNLIPGTVSYDPAVHTVVLRPSSALNTNVTYTATIKGGPSGVSDIAGNRLASDVSWSFITGSSPPPQAATPTFSPAAGTYSSAQSVTISDTSAGTQIYYTTDGTTPTTSSTLYTGPVLVSTTTTIKAIAAGAGWTTSAVGSATYTIQISSTPAAPSSLSATPFSATQVNLAWTDNSSNETAFLLERKTGSGGTYAQIASIAANTVSYSDNSATASTTYFYRMRATNANGNSAYSNEATATTPGATAVPSPWSDVDIGSVGQAGSATYLNGTFTVKGSGSDIWNTADAFHFVYQPWTGDGEIIAQVASVQNTDVWAKAGVMIRETLSASSKHAMMIVTPGSGVSFQRRTSTGGTSVDTTTTGRTAPQFLRLTRVGSTFTAYYSSTGTSWTQIGSATISMASTVQFGLPVTAHNNSALCTAVINTVSVGTSLGAPTGLTAAATSSSQINLSWIDHATAETGFKIERKTGSGGTYAQIATVGANVTNYTDTGLNAGTTYFYRVRANNSTSNSSYSNEASATTQSNPPGAPTNLGANAISSSQINLAWTDNASNETGFKIERKTGAGGTYAQVATVGANVTTYSDSGLTANTNYFYRVRANNSSGDSSYSNEANATTLDTTPTAPGNLAANAVSTTQINLTWSDNASNETGFKIERKTGSGGTYAQIGTVGANVTSYSDSGLTSGTTYYYRVRANNAVGDSGYSNEANATTFSTPPAAPTGLGATATSSSQINLAWTDNASNETGFKIERKTGSGGTYAQIATVGANVVIYSDNGVNPSTTYYYRVRATNTGGDSSYSNEANATTNAAPTGGLEGDYFDNIDLTGYVLSRVDSMVNFDWGTGSPDPSIGADTFSVRWTGQVQPQYSETYTFYTTSDDGVRLWVNGQLLVDNWTDHGPTENSGTITLTANQKYDIVMTYYENGGGAVAQLSWSSTSQAKQIIPPNRLFPVPAAPVNLAASAVSTSQINLTWTDNSANETGFKIERKTGSGGTYAQIATTGANVTSYNDTGLSASTNYYYRVRATNSIGDSAYSNEANATTSSTLPAAPSALTASSSSATQINLAWADNATNETGFKIERKTGSGGTYSQIATVGAGVVGYSNTGLTPGTSYYYRVRATNAAGDSAYSNEANTTSLAAPAFRAAASNAAASGSLVINKPTGTVQNDVMVASIAVRPNTTTITAPSGWTLVRRTDNTSTNPNSLATYYKVAGSSEPTSYTWTLGSSAGAAGGIQSFSGVNTANPIDVEGGQNTANALTLTAPGVTTASTYEMLVTSHAFASSATFTNPTGMTEAFDKASVTVPSSGGEAIEGNYQLLTAAGATGSKTATASGDADAGNAHTLALKGITLTPLPTAPGNLTASAISTTQINLSWVDNATNESGYKIERKTGAGGTYAQIATVGANATSYNDTGLTTGTTYFYRVRATSSSGDSAYSNEASATTLLSVPSAPTGLTATAISSSQINLSWSDVANETGFKIERKTGAGGTYAQIATTGANITTYSDTGLTAGTTYFYRVRATNASGDSSYSNETSATTVVSPPNAPSGLTATATSSTQINLSWTDVANETGFKIERKTGVGGTYSQIATVGAGIVSYSNTGLTANTNYYYRVRATNAGGDSPYSNEANATTLDTAPAAPSGLTATAISTTQINLSWTDNASNETGFKIERKTGAGGTYAQIGTVGANLTSYNDTGLTDGTTYFYRVRATNAVGDSAYSSETSTTTLVAPPAAPNGLTATAISSSQINLSWTDVSNETGYKIERKTGSGGTYSQVGTVGANVTTYNDTGLTVNTTYYYRVRATNTGGDSPYSNEANATTLNGIPAAPTSLGAVAFSISQIDLSWTDNSPNESGFKIERKTGSGGSYAEIATVGADVTTYSDTGLTEGTNYFYRVRATNAVGDSAYSNEANATTFTNPPDAPTGLAATTTSSTQIDLSWTDVANETGFKIERKTGVGGSYSQIATVGAGVVTYSNTGLAPNTTYYYRVRATNAGGDSPYSNEANATTLDSAPAAPSALAATAVSTTQINLSWTDNASNETGFKIERKTGSGGTYAEIGTVGANVTTYNDAGLSPTTTYYYRVRATNSIGDSGYSNEANATTSTPIPDAPSDLTATVFSSSEIDLTWTDNSSNETGFKIERKLGVGGTYSQIATVGAGVASYNDTSLVVNTTYYYRVRATNAGGDSAYSAEAHATTLDVVPPAPSGLAAIAVSVSQINLSWTRNSMNETGFKIERKTGAGGTYSQIATVGAGVVTYNDTGLATNTTYFYRVRATNAVGDSAYSNEASATTQLNPPAAPTGLTVSTPSTTQINLLWTDNSSDETGFKIERKTGAGGTYAQIATVGASVTSYSNTGLTPGTTYFYRVRATNASGDSAYSNEASTTTLTTIWPDSATPAFPDQLDGVPATEVGVRFKSDRAGWIVALRFYKGASNTGVHTGHLWSNTGTLLATVTFTNETASGWQKANLSTPIAITAGTPYVASCFFQSQHFSSDSGYFAGQGHDQPPLHALADGVAGPNGVWHDSTSAFPTDTYDSPNFWIDVVFSDTPNP